ncbi:MAG TPA: type II toxin-antitoxin system mRNA interferase toxin, RelE/StbE family [Myxococcota bacterium]|nr:type II toxin-antitoxin system mRNA interferase toxin, RelE/StbE family [Myxococcota bacterium]
MEIYDVNLSPQAKKDLRVVPQHIRDKFQGWVKTVEKEGLREVQKTPGYHDEPLKGKRKGQRSIRLNRAYRAIYVIKGKEIELVWVEEVTHHEY